MKTISDKKIEVDSLYEVIQNDETLRILAYNHSQSEGEERNRILVQMVTLAASIMLTNLVKLSPEKQ